MRGGGHHVGIRHRVLVQPRRHQPRDMCHIHHQIRAHLVRNFTEFCKINGAGVCAGARQNQLRFVLFGKAKHLVIINAPGGSVHPVRHDVEVFARNIDGGTVRKVPAVRQTHGKHGVPGLKQGKKHGKIGIGAAVGLHVGVLRPEELFGTLPCQLLHLVHIHTAAVIALAGVPLRVFVGQHTACRQQHRLGNDVFGGNQFDILPLTAQLPLTGGKHFRIIIFQFFPKHIISSFVSSIRDPAGFPQ